MSLLFQGKLITSDGMIHPKAIGRIQRITITNDPNPSLLSAQIVIKYYRDRSAMDELKSPIAERSYWFLPGGDHDYHKIFLPGEDCEENLFQYLLGLHEFNGWRLA